MKQIYLTYLLLIFGGISTWAQLISPGVTVFGKDMPAESQYFSRFNSENSEPQNFIQNDLNLNQKNPSLVGNFYIEFPYQGISTPMQSVTDSEGNTYITGTSSHEEAPKGNMLTLKVNPDGEIEWMTREETVDFVTEFGFTIALDENKNPVVAGVEWNGNDMDIRTVKYDKGTGESIWESVFDGGYNGLDYPSKITVDHQGNVLVAGFSYVNETIESVNYTTLKYSSDGNLLWSNIDNFEVEGIWIEPNAIATDLDGNVAVTGFGSTENLYQTFYTIKYSAEGELLWKRTYAYNDSGNPTNSISNYVKFDDSGNCYVTGTFNSGGYENPMGTIKYSPEGEELWVQTHQIPEHSSYGYGLLIHEDKIYVAGMHRTGGYECGAFLISYNPDGSSNWVKETSGLNISGSGLGVYVQFELDAQNQPVIGIHGENEDFQKNVKILQYNEAGDLIQEKNYTKESNGLFSLNALVGLGISDSNDFTIVMDNGYTEEGGVYEFTNFSEEGVVPEWNNFYGNMGGSNTMLSEALPDGFGNTIVAGSYGAITEIISYMQNFFVAKYDASGGVLWQHSFNEDNGNPASKIMLEVNNEGETIVVLISSPFDSNPLFVKKYSPSGDLIWEFQKELTQAEISSLNVDDEGNIYIAGNSIESEDEFIPKFTVLKISSQGTEQWTKWITSENPDDNLYYIGKGITHGSTITFTGHTGIGSFFSQSSNLVSFQLSSEGELNWMRTSSLSGWNSGGTDLYVDDENQIYSIGWKENSNNINLGNLYMVKYAAGEIIWEKDYTQPERRVRSYAIKPLSDGNLIVTGFSVIDNVNNRVIALKFNEDGDLLWEYNSEFNEFFRDVYIDDLDNIYLLNQVYTSTYPHRLYHSSSPFRVNALKKISADGNLQDESIFMGPEFSDADPEGLVPQQDGRLLLGNTISSEISHFSGVYFFTSSHETLETNDHPELNKDQNYLGQNYPNPAGGKTQIPFYITENSWVNIVLYDASGKYVKELINTEFPKGENSISVYLNELPQGIYFYQMKSNDFKQTKKLIIR